MERGFGALFCIFQRLILLIRSNTLLGRDRHPRSFGHPEACGDISKHGTGIPMRIGAQTEANAFLPWGLRLSQRYDNAIKETVLCFDPS